MRGGWARALWAVAPGAGAGAGAGEPEDGAGAHVFRDELPLT